MLILYEFNLFHLIIITFTDERLQMLDDSLSRERNFPNQSPAEEPAITEGNPQNTLKLNFLCFFSQDKNATFFRILLLANIGDFESSNVPHLCFRIYIYIYTNLN